MTKQEIMNDIKRHWKNEVQTQKKIRAIWRKILKTWIAEDLHDFCNDIALDLQLSYNRLNELEDEYRDKCENE